MGFARNRSALARASTPASRAFAAGLGGRGVCGVRGVARVLGLMRMRFVGLGVRGFLSAVRSGAVARGCAFGCARLGIRRIVWFSCQKLVWVCCKKDGGATFDVTPPSPSRAAD